MDVICIGAALIDRTYRAAAAVRPATSNPSRAYRGFGGVARNVAESLARLGHAVAFYSAVGDDADGIALLTHASRAGVDVSGVRVVAARTTGEYVAILEPDGELAVGASDAGPVDTIDAAAILAATPALTAARWVFADGNLGSDAAKALLDLRARSGFRLAIDAVSAAKVLRLPADLRDVDLLVINVHQAARLARMPDARAVLLTRGAEGADLIVGGETTHLPALAVAAVDVTGAGDALAAGTLHHLLEGAALLDAVRGGMLAAALTVESAATVRADLSPALLLAERHRL